MNKQAHTTQTTNHQDDYYVEWIHGKIRQIVLLIKQGRNSVQIRRLDSTEELTVPKSEIQELNKEEKQLACIDVSLISFE
jgi:hypothetical protein